MDRVVEEAQVTRATFYRHFPSKEDLVRAYLQAEDQRIRGRVAEVRAETGTATDALNLLLGGIGAEICGPGFRGCPFINAAAEYPDKRSPGPSGRAGAPQLVPGSHSRNPPPR